jgi:hypothetical protein
MRKISAIAMAALFCTTSVLLACDKEGKVVLAGAKTHDCCKASFDKAVAGVMNAMPSMTYRVGEMDTPCFKSATAKAGKDGKVQYLVAGKAYDAETEATVALAGLLEKEIENLQVVQLSVGGKSYGCSMSAKAALKDGEKMKYRLAGFDFATKEQAEKAQKIINCKLKGCDSDCIKDCVKNFPAKLTADGKKAGCNPNCNMGKAKATTASAKDSPCHQGKGAKATTAAAKDGAPCPHAVDAGAKKGGCNKGKATTASAEGDKPCCAKGNKAKAATVAAEGDKPCDKPCNKSKAAAAVASSGSPCNKAAKAATVAAKGDKPCCAKGNKAKATTVAAEGDKPCNKSKTAAAVASSGSPCNKAGKAATVAAKGDKPCCAKGNKAKATTVAAGDSPCGKSKAAKAATVAAGDSPCNKSKAAAAVASSGSPCNKAGEAKTVAAEEKGGCCKKAQQRLATVQDQVKLIVETAATLALSS